MSTPPATTKTRRSPPHQMFQTTPHRAGSISPIRLGGILSFSQEDEEDVAKLMDVRLDNYLDDLPAAEELKTDMFGSARKRCRLPKLSRRVTIATAVTVVILIALITLIVTQSRPVSSLSSSSSSEGISSKGSSSELDEIMNLLLDGVDKEALENQTSPQYKAAKWIADTDPRRNEDRGLYQRYALALLWFATEGESWQHSIGFLSHKHECEWNTPYQHFDHTVRPMGVVCDGNKKVTSLTLQTIGLKGSIPSELKMIPGLRTLELDRNELVDMDGVRELKQVQRLTIGFNNFSHYEAIPAWIGELTNLRTLGLSNNRFKSTIPWEAFSRLSSLSTLLLDDNDLSGDLGVLFQNMTAPPLRELYLQGNALEGVVADALIDNLEYLQVLDVSNNELEGRVSVSWFGHPRLRYLAMHKNYLDGPVLPEDLPHSTTLEFLSLHGNFLEGIIPESVNNLSNLRHLDVADNRMGPIDGSWSPKDWLVPQSIIHMTNLETLLLNGNNRITPGPIPAYLQYLTNLKQLSLKATARTGTIPEWIGTTLEKLVMLDLDNNRLNSTIPSSLSELPDLRYLLLSRNTLQGHIPPQLKHLENLKMLLLDQNELTGDLHHVCRKLTHLSVVMTDCGAVECDCCKHCCPPQADDDDDEVRTPQEVQGCSSDSLLSLLRPSILLWDNDNYDSDILNRPQFNYSADVVYIPSASTMAP